MCSVTTHSRVNCSINAYQVKKCGGVVCSVTTHSRVTDPPSTTLETMDRIKNMKETKKIKN